MTSESGRAAQIARLYKSLNRFQVNERQQTEQSPHLIGAPAPQLGEAFSSWCYRLQQTFRLPMKNLRAMLFLPQKIPLFWADVALSATSADRIAGLTRSHSSLFEQFSYAAGSLLSQPEFSCLTCAPLERLPLYRYCPDCWRADAIPYLRMYWRFSFCYFCSEHQVVLRDHCPKCQALFVPKFGSDLPLDCCPRCHESLSKSNGRAVPSALWNLAQSSQAEFRRLAAMGRSSRLLEVQPSVKIAEAVAPLVGNEGRIDASNIANHRLLWEHLLAGLQETDVLEARAVFARVQLLRFLLGNDVLLAEGAVQALAWGVDGQALFGCHAQELMAYLRGEQILERGTHWHPRDSGLHPMAESGSMHSTGAAAIAWINRLKEHDFQ